MNASDLANGCAPCTPNYPEGVPSLGWLPAPFSIAFQPIGDVLSRKVIGHEAMVRGPRGEPASTVLGAAPPDEATRLDRLAREKALRLGAARTEGLLFLNASASAVVHQVDGPMSTLQRAERLGITPDRIVFELTEQDPAEDLSAVRDALDDCRKRGARIAVDDFGAGWSNLQRVIELRPDIIKLDMSLVRGIDACSARQAVARSVSWMARDLGALLIGEGVETAAESSWLRSSGVHVQQGRWLAAPGFEEFPSSSQIHWG